MTCRILARKWNTRIRRPLQTADLLYFVTNNLLGHGDNIKVHINVKFGNIIRSRLHKKSIAMTSTENTLVDVTTAQSMLGRIQDGRTQAQSKM